MNHFSEGQPPEKRVDMKRFTAPRKSRSIFATVLALSLIAALSVLIVPTVSAQTAFSQCNGVDNVGGQAVECHYTVTNNINGDATSSTVVLEECHGAANDPPTMVCNTTTSSSGDLVTSIDQCNGSGNGGGGTVTCTVDVTNNIVGTVTPSPATVNQCNASGTGGGTEPTILCNPFPANTTGANVTQCNESGNGGGGTQRVQCTVDDGSTTTSILNISVNQCNGSGNGGGATVTCRTGIRNVIEAQPEPTDTPTPGPTDVPTPGPTEGPVPTVPDGGPDAPDAPAGPDGGPDAPDDTDGPGLETGQVVRVPQGGAGAGSGSTSGVENVGLLILGFLMLVAAVPVLAVRRRTRVQA